MSERKRGYVIVHQGHEDDYYEECSICHNKDVSVDDNYCSNCGVMFFGIKNRKLIENKTPKYSYNSGLCYSNGEPCYGEDLDSLYQEVENGSK